jgi:hypothetical protein
VIGANGLQEIRRSLSIGAPAPTQTRAIPSTGAPALRATETGAPASLSTEALALHVMGTDSQPALSIEAPGLHAMETGMLLTKAPSDPSEASALSTTMCQ